MFFLIQGLQPRCITQLRLDSAGVSFTLSLSNDNSGTDAQQSLNRENRSV